MNKKLEVRPNIDTTRFVNIYDKSFDIYIDKEVARHFEAGEEHIVPVFVARVGAKHLVDLILQKREGLSDSMRDTPLRKSLFAEILPDVAEDIDMKPLSDEEVRKEVEKQLKEQKTLIEGLGASASQKDKEIEQLKKDIETLKRANTPEIKGRSKKTE